MVLQSSTYCEWSTLSALPLVWVGWDLRHLPGTTLRDCVCVCVCVCGTWGFSLYHRLIGKDPDSGKDGRQEEKGTTEDKLVGWYHQLNGREFEQAPGDSERKGSLAFCSPWGWKELDVTEQLNNKNKFKIVSSSWRIVFFFYCVLTFFKWLLFDLKNLFCVTLKELFSNLEKSV